MRCDEGYGKKVGVGDMGKDGAVKCIGRGK